MLIRLSGTGRTITICELSPGHRPQLERGFGRLSAGSRRLRYGLPLVDPDRALGWVALLGLGQHFGLGACADMGGEPVGVARYVRDGDSVEVAVTVVDAWQGQGVGTRLLGELLRYAHAQGIACLRASVLAENRRAIRLAQRFGAQAAQHGWPGVIEYDLPLADTARPSVRHDTDGGALRS